MKSPSKDPRSLGYIKGDELTREYFKSLKSASALSDGISKRPKMKRGLMAKVITIIVGVVGFIFIMPALSMLWLGVLDVKFSEGETLSATLLFMIGVAVLICLVLTLEKHEDDNGKKS